MSVKIKDWVGKRVSVRLRNASVMKVEGILLEMNESFVLIDRQKDEPLLIPIGSVLHLEPLSNDPPAVAVMSEQAGRPRSPYDV